MQAIAVWIFGTMILMMWYGIMLNQGERIRLKN